MRKISIFVCVALLGFAGTLMQRKGQHPAQPPVEAAINVSQLPMDTASQTSSSEQTTAQVAELASIPLDHTRLQYLTNVRLDDQGNLYFLTIDAAGRRDPKGKIIKLNPELQQYDEINVKFALGRPSPDSVMLQAYDVDRFGNIYMVTAKPEALLIQDAGGAVISEVDFSDFVPTTVSADPEGNIWVGGSALSSRNPVTVKDTQLRVYNPSGQLLAVPASGFDRDDLRLARFTHSHGMSEILTGARIYSFKGHTFAAAYEYPFKSSPLKAFITSEKKRDRSNRLLLGLSSVGRNLLSFGVQPDEKGHLRAGFVALVSPSGKPVTPEFLIPQQYGRPVAAAPDGTLYCLHQTERQLFLTKLRIIDLKGKRGK